MKTTYLILPLLLPHMDVSAAERYEVAIRDVSVRKSHDRVVVDFVLDPSDFPQNYRLTVVPMLYNDANRRVKALQTITLVGRNKHLSDIRAGKNTNRYHMMTRHKSGPIHYSDSLPYEDWMQTVSVSVYQIGEDCCCRHESQGGNIAEDRLLYFKPMPVYSRDKLDYQLTELEKYDLENIFLLPIEDYPRRYEILLSDRQNSTAKLIFKTGSAVIDPDYKGNNDVLEDVAHALELIRQDPNAILEKIVIAGYASPEGSLATNTRLAEARAQAVKKYLLGRMNAPDDIFELYNGREDWDGLREMVDSSAMAGREQVLSILGAYTMEQQVRKDKLKQLDHGAPYRYMLENFYPELRSGGYIQVYYRIDRRATIPAAVTDYKGRTTWIDPESPANLKVAAINEATELMNEQRFDDAIQLLEYYSDDPITWNSLGVCLMMGGYYDRADSYFRRAADNGDRNAPVNLEQTRRIRQVVQ